MEGVSECLPCARSDARARREGELVNVFSELCLTAHGVHPAEEGYEHGFVVHVANRCRTGSCCPEALLVYVL